MKKILEALAKYQHALYLIFIICFIFRIKVDGIVLLILTVLYAAGVIYSCKDHPKLLLIASGITIALIAIFIAAMKTTIYLIDNKVFFIR